MSNASQTTSKHVIIIDTSSTKLFCHSNKDLSINLTVSRNHIRQNQNLAKLTHKQQRVPQNFPPEDEIQGAEADILIEQL